MVITDVIRSGKDPRGITEEIMIQNISSGFYKLLGLLTFFTSPGLDRIFQNQDPADCLGYQNKLAIARYSCRPVVFVVD